MDTNKIITNEEVIETTEDIVTASSGKTFKVVAGVGLTVLGGVVAYKYVIKPLVAKIKAKKKQQKIEVEFESYDNVNNDEESEEN